MELGPEDVFLLERYSHSSQEGGVSGISVKQVRRIENRKLHNRFTSAVQTILEQRPDSIPPHDNLSDLVEYLFLVWNPGMYMHKCHFKEKLSLFLWTQTCYQ